MKRKERIYKILKAYEQRGIISYLVIQGNMPGLRWTFSPAGYSSRAMTTNEVEWFIMGVEAREHSI